MLFIILMKVSHNFVGKLHPTLFVYTLHTQMMCKINMA